MATAAARRVLCDYNIPNDSSTIVKGFKETLSQASHSCSSLFTFNCTISSIPTITALPSESRISYPFESRISYPSESRIWLPHSVHGAGCYIVFVASAGPITQSSYPITHIFHVLTKHIPIICPYAITIFSLYHRGGMLRWPGSE